MWKLHSHQRPIQVKHHGMIEAFLMEGGKKAFFFFSLLIHFATIYSFISLHKAALS